jgi:hypothetical protein
MNNSYPVFRVITDYPNSRYTVGQLVTTDSAIWINNNILFAEQAESYPHIFQRITKEEFENQQNKKALSR